MRLSARWVLGSSGVTDRGSCKNSSGVFAREKSEYRRQERLLQNPPDAAPDGLRPRGFAGFFAEAVGPTLNKRTRQGHRCIFWPFSDRRRRPGPVAGGFSEAGVRLGQGQASILSICSAAMTSKPKAMCAATLTGPRTRTCRPPCSSCRWLLTRSTAVRSL
jgi:hypothetical protein